MLKLIQFFEKHKIICIAIFIAIIAGVFFLKFTMNKSKENEAEKQAEAQNQLTIEEFMEQIKPDILQQGTMSITAKYDDVPFAMEGSIVNAGKVSYMSGRSAVDPKNNAFNNSYEQYIEKIGNISTFYTQNPDDHYSEWIKETYTDGLIENKKFVSMSELPTDLENVEIDEESKAPESTAYLLKGTLSAEKFSNYFYNIFGETALDCNVTIAIDKASFYIIGIQVVSQENSKDHVSELVYTINYSSPKDPIELGVPDNIRNGAAQEGCLLYYLKDEALNKVEEE